MRVIEGGEVVNSGNEGGGTCHNDKPGQSKDIVLKMGIQKGGDAGRVKKGGAGATCHNDKLGRNDGYGGSRYDGGGGEGVRGEAGGRVRLATVASRVMCLRRWKPGKKKDE